MKKRLFCMILALVLMFTLLPCAVFAEEGETTPPTEETVPTPEPTSVPTPEPTPVPSEDLNDPEQSNEPETLEIVYPELEIILEGDSGKKLSGGKFVLKGTDDAVVKEWTTDENGAFQMDWFTDGEYVLEQTASHSWYEVSAEAEWKIVVSDGGMRLELFRFDSEGQPVSVVVATADAPASLTVTNTKKHGTLTISKTVSFEKDGTAAETADWTTDDEDEAFELTVTLSDEGGTPFAGILSGVEFAEGSAVIALKETDSLSLEQIPYGWQYTVTPKTDATAVVCSVTNGEGTIAAETTAAEAVYAYRFVTRNEGLTVLWVNAENTEEIVNGGKMALHGSDNALIAECAADAEGKITFAIPEEGTYTLTESGTPDGFFSNDESIELTAVKETKIVDGVTEEHMVITADSLEAVADTENGYLFKSTSIKPVTISVNAVWDVPEGFTAMPDSVVVQLYRDGTAYGDPVTLNEENGWKHKWSGGAYTNAYAWDVEQTEAPAGYTEAVISEDGYAFSIVNKLEYGRVNVSVSKSWLNPKNYDKQPASVKVVLYRNGDAYETVTLGETNGWMYRWKNLPDCFVWTVDEPTVPENYKKKITHVGNAWVIVNAHEEIPLTGDDSNVGLWAGATGAAVVGLGICAFLLLKKRKNDDE